MPRKMIRLFLILSISVVLVLAACSSPKPAPQGIPPGISGSPKPVSPPSSGKPSAKPASLRISATWITAEQNEDSLTVPLAEIKKNTIIHFLLNTPEGEGKMPFMAYDFEGKTYVRADICVPCRSYNYSLYRDILVCDACGTQFEARTGKGISGACVAYPKAEVRWEVTGDKIVLKNEELKTAFLDTLQPGLP